VSSTKCVGADSIVTLAIRQADYIADQMKSNTI
jgi:hypothetical protein